MNRSPLHEELSRRERQVMDALFALDEGTAHDELDRIAAWIEEHAEHAEDG